MKNQNIYFIVVGGFWCDKFHQYQNAKILKCESGCITLVNYTGFSLTYDGDYWHKAKKIISKHLELSNVEQCEINNILKYQVADLGLKKMPKKWLINNMF